MQRLLLALSAAALTVTGIALYYNAGPEYAATAAACLKSGPVLAAIALAFPQLKRLFARVPPWYIACVLAGLLIMLRWPKGAMVVLPTLVVLWFLGPRSKRPPPAPRKRRKEAARQR